MDVDSFLLLFKIGFLPVRFADILDILIVGYLVFLLYKLLPGTIPFNIFLGLVTIGVAYWIVRSAKMDLLTAVLGQFVSLGLILIVIIFQQEIRRFLLLLGSNALGRRFILWLRNINNSFQTTSPKARNEDIQAIARALFRIQEKGYGALVVLTNQLTLEGIATAGTVLDASISASLLESIFSKDSPLHDGAVLIGESRIRKASCVLPTTDNTRLPARLGLRHRAALGVSEKVDVAVFVVSEERHQISMALRGELIEINDMADLEAKIRQHYEG